jgi:hypothetical protein
MPPLEVTRENLQPAVQAALSAWSRLDGTPQDWLEHLFLIQQRRASIPEELPVILRLATNELLHTSIEELALQDQASADILSMRFLERDKIQKVANHLHCSPDQVKRLQRKAIWALTDIILRKELMAREEQAQIIESLLMPPTYRALFGVETLLQELVSLLLAEDPPIVAVTGIGGIGKTSLVDAAVRRLIRSFHFDKVVWLTVDPGANQPHRIPAHLTRERLSSQLAPVLCPYMPLQTPAAERDLQLRQVLKAFPYLIVIDNLEAEAEPSLLNYLHALAGASKFLLTSRIRPMSEAGISNFPIPELAVEDALQLIRDQAAAIAAHDLNTLSDEELLPIYEHVGGNPLAMKLIVGLSHDLSLPDILSDLRQVQTQQIEEMYQHIYWKAWRTLTPEARALLEVMPMAAGSGMAQNQLQAVSRLESKELLRAIQELSQRSLLEVRGTTLERRYAIHGLTRTFLHSEIIHWSPDVL